MKHPAKTCDELRSAVRAFAKLPRNDKGDSVDAMEKLVIDKVGWPWGTLAAIDESIKRHEFPLASLLIARAVEHEPESGRWRIKSVEADHAFQASSKAATATSTWRRQVERLVALAALPDPMHAFTAAHALLMTFDEVAVPHERREQARSLLTKCIETTPDNPWWYWGLKRVCVRGLSIGGGLERSAYEACEEALRRAPSNPIGYFELGDCYHYEKDAHRPSQSIEMYERALALDPDYPDAKLALALLLKPTDQARARTLLTELLDFDPGSSCGKAARSHLA